MNGYIKIYKKIEDWQWYKYSSTLHLFLDLLLEANWQDSKVGELVIEKGQVLTSIERMSKRTGLTPREIRTSLSRLEKSGEIDKQTTNRYSIITIKKYNDYQENDKQKTSKRQTKDNIKEYKEYKEINNKESISKDIPKKVETKYFESLKVNTIFNEFLELRKKLKAVNNDRAINTLINKLNNYDEETQYEMIEQSIVNSWKGIFELKNQKSKSYTFTDLLKEGNYE